MLARALTIAARRVLRRFGDWLDRHAAPLQRIPLTIDHSLTIGLIAAATLLALAVVLLVRVSDSSALTALTLIAAMITAFLLLAWYARARLEVARQDELVRRLIRDAADFQALHDLAARIQASHSAHALSEAVRDFARDVFPDTPGLVATRSAKQGFEVLASWGTSVTTGDRIGTCYAARDGETFSSLSAREGYRCQHVERTYDGPYMCFPIRGEPGTAGFLHLRYPAESDEDTRRRRRLGEAAASRIAIGLDTIELHHLLRTQSMVDPLTGLNNRRALFDHASRVHAAAIGKRGTYSVILADVDRFKALNDTLGHAAGDTILVTFARHLQRLIRSQDFACRYGGEEFVVVMPDSSREVAAQRAEAMRVALGSLRTTVPKSVWRLSASFGVAAFPADGNSFPEVLRRADEAMYEAKLAGRNRVTSWNRQLRLDRLDEPKM